MAEVALSNVLPGFPVGTKVDVYGGILDDSGEPRPVGPVLDSAVVNAEGEVAFTDLPEEGVVYVAAAQLGDGWVFRYFSTPPPPTALAVERTDRISADEAEQQAREAADDAEQVAREAADALLVELLGEKVDEEDPRLSDTRDPKAHAASHAAGAADPITPGAIGAVAACRYRYLTSTGTFVDPGAGKLNFNAGKTTLVINETDLDGRALAGWLATFDDSTNGEARGTITLRKASDPSVFAIYRVTGAVTDLGSYDWVAVALVASGGEFANEDIVSLEFSRAGDKGATGAAGASGAAPYRMIGAGRCRLEADVVSGYYRMGQTYLRNVIYTTSYAAGTAEDKLPITFRLNAADLAVEGKTTKLRIRARIHVNATKPEGVTFRAGLYVVGTPGGAADALTIGAPGSAVGSEAIFSSPPASTTTEVDTGDFNMIGDGLYQLLCFTSAALTNNSLVAIEAEIMVRNV